jgi:hypothetical protein
MQKVGHAEIENFGAGNLLRSCSGARVTISCKLTKYKPMFMRPVFLIALIWMLAVEFPKLALSQCANHVTMVPFRAMKAASSPRDFVRFRYALSSSDSLLIQSHESTDTELGPYDFGFQIERNGKTMRSVALRDLPAFRSEDSYSAEDFTALAVTRVCTGGGPISFVTMKCMGDEISPALIFILVPSVHGYEVSTLPMISGGTVEVSSADPLHLRVWDSLHEGRCNACETAYRITDYEIRDGKPVKTGQHRTRRLYSSGQFDDSRIRFVR